MKKFKMKNSVISGGEVNGISSWDENFSIQLFAEDGEAGGNDTADAVQISSEGTDTDTDNEFLELIKGKYKDAFTRKTQSIINRRFKETKNLEEYKGKAEEILATLRTRYGLSENDFEGLLARVNGEGKVDFNRAEVLEDASEGESVAEDNANYLTDETESNENAPESADEKESSDSERIMKRVGQEKRTERVLRQYADWMAQAEQLSALYPDFDLKRECEDPQFVAVLLGGASVKRAYESAHHEEILSGAMEYTAKTVSEAMSRSMRAKGTRPFENGLGSKAALYPAKDVDSLTDSDISEILKQVANGKIIKF